MYVASLPLCKELFELSGWRLTYLEWKWYDNYATNKPTEPELRKRTGHGAIAAKYRYPAYDSGYLLRRLHEADMYVTIENHGIASQRYYWTAEEVAGHEVKVRDHTPENALCKLAIELFKQRILGGKSSD